MKSINCIARTSIDLTQYGELKASNRKQLKQISRKQLRAREKEQLRSELAEWCDQAVHALPGSTLERVEAGRAPLVQSLPAHKTRRRSHRRSSMFSLSKGPYARQLIDSTVTIHYVNHNRAMRDVACRVMASCALA